MKPIWPHPFVTDRCSRWDNTMASSQMRTHTSGRWQRWAYVHRCRLAGQRRQNRTRATQRPRLHSGWRDAAASGLFLERMHLQSSTCCLVPQLVLVMAARPACEKESIQCMSHLGLRPGDLQTGYACACERAPSAFDSGTTRAADAAHAQAVIRVSALVLLRLLLCIPACCRAAHWGPARRQEESGKVQEEHPLDNYFRELIRRRRREMLRRKRAALKSLQVRNSVRSVASLCCGLLPGEAQEIAD